MARLDDLRGLLACLRGDAQAVSDWTGVIALANKTLCVPTAAARLMQSGAFPSLPPDVATFLADVHRRNEDRNRRLLKQLDEAAATLNAISVLPVALKGTAWLAGAKVEHYGDRLLADLDLMVPPDRFFAVAEQLETIGYRPESPLERPDIPAVLSRTQDAATIDLHCDYGGAAALLYGYADLARDAAMVDLPSGIVGMPSAAGCIAVLLLHDQLKGRDYLRGRIDLRHLLDIQHFAKACGEEDWDELERLFARPYARNAMRTQLLTARKLLGVAVPDRLVRGVRARLQYRRRMVQLRWPSATPMLTLLSMLDPSYLAARRASRRLATQGGTAPQFLPRRDSMDRLFFRNELGKI